MRQKLLRLDNSADYRIEVQGVLDSNWSDRLNGLSIFSEGENEVTVLAGSLIDQAALLGVLNTLYDLRMPLLSVQCLTYGSKQAPE